MPRKGQLIVIDGIDGSGKATQAELLVKKLKQDGRRVKLIDFPRYNDNFFGSFISECIEGKHANLATLDPSIASILFACDRWESQKVISSWIKNGYIVVADRYVSANQIHQGGKLQNARDRKKFLGWLDTLEYDIFGLKRPDLIMYLDVPVATALKLLETRNKNMRRKNDVTEKTIQYLENARKSALTLSRSMPNWRRVQCIKKGKLQSIQEVHERVWKIVENAL